MKLSGNINQFQQVGKRLIRKQKYYHITRKETSKYTQSYNVTRKLRSEVSKNLHKLRVNYAEGILIGYWRKPLVYTIITLLLCSELFRVKTKLF